MKKKIYFILIALMLLPIFALKAQRINNERIFTKENTDKVWKYGKMRRYWYDAPSNIYYVSSETEYTFDEDDRPKTITYKYYNFDEYSNSHSTLWSSSIYRYEYGWNKNPRVEIEEKYDKNGNLEKKYTRIYEYDPICTDVVVRTANAKGQWSSGRKITRDEQGRIIKSEAGTRLICHYPNDSELGPDRIEYYNYDGELRELTNIVWHSCDGQLWSLWIDEDPSDFPVYRFNSDDAKFYSHLQNPNQPKSFDVLFKDGNGKTTRKMHVENEYTSTGASSVAYDYYSYKSWLDSIDTSIYRVSLNSVKYLDDNGSYVESLEEYDCRGYNNDGEINYYSRRGHKYSYIYNDDGLLCKRGDYSILYPSMEEKYSGGMEYKYTMDDTNGQIIRRDDYEEVYEDCFIHWNYNEYEGYRELVNGIQTTKSSTDDKNIYDLYGRKTDKLRPGINIIQGKKIFVPFK